MLVIDQARNGGTVEVKAGEPFRVQLNENPTTGYRWYLASPADAALRVVEDTFDPAAPDKRGAGGMRHWTFTADRPAVVKLRFERKRAWEPQAAESFAVTVAAAAR